MKELLQGVLALIGAAIVSIPMFTLGFLWSLGYSFWLSISLKKWNAFFIFWWRLIDGLAAALGHILYGIGFGLDLGWNVNGELLEDVITHEENTTFSQKNITVSATVGKLEIDGKLNGRGKLLSKLLNYAFWQKQHAKDAWLYTQAHKELRSKYFKSLK